MPDPKTSRWRNLFHPAPRGETGDGTARPSAPDDPALAESLERHRRALQEAAGTTAPCAIGRGGESWPAVKYHEGAVVALREVRRAADDPRARATRLLEVWTGAQREARSAGMGGDWTAYRAGGIDALVSYLGGAPDPERP